MTPRCLDRVLLFPPLNRPRVDPRQPAPRDRRVQQISRSRGSLAHWWTRPAGRHAGYAGAPRGCRRNSPPPMAKDASRASLATLSRTPLLIIDDWGPGAADRRATASFSEIVDDRCRREGSLVRSPDRSPALGRWHEVIGDHTIGDAILDWRYSQSTLQLRLSRGPACASATILEVNAAVSTGQTNAR